MTLHRRTFLTVLVLFVAACASGRTSQPQGTSENVITRAELQAAGSVSAYEAIQRLRPTFLRNRGPVSLVNANARTRPVVFIDMTEYGEIESLRNLDASRIQEVRYFPGQQAVTRFGSVFGAGVIQLTLRVQ